MLISPVSFNNKTNLFHNKIKKENKNINFTSNTEHATSQRYPLMFVYRNPYSPTPNKETFDTFTGLRDKKCLMCALEEAMDLSKKTGKEFSVAMFDMDNFKSVNELLGYTTGDKFIKTISSDIDYIAKSNDVKAYRFGGEEFVMIFDKQPMEKICGTVRSILATVGSEPIMRSYNEEYKQKALERLESDRSKYNKINAINYLETKKELVKDLRKNLKTDEAKNDPYFDEVLDDIDTELSNSYIKLINERIKNEINGDTVKWLIDIRDKISEGKEIDSQEQQDLKDYLWSIYDKSYEIHRIKKWLSDFDKKGGFSITGGVVRYSSYALKDETPIDIINEVGEVLKKNKQVESGDGYGMVAV